MERRAPPSRILLYQSLGFLAIIALSWLDEWLGLPSLILQDHPYICDFHESTLEMLLILAVWLLVATSTRRVLIHVRRLEKFMRICAWCRRIDHKGNWVRIEDFFEKDLRAPTSHCICPECLKQQAAARERPSSRTTEPPAQEAGACG